MRDGVRKDAMAESGERKLVTTRIAALYLLFIEHPNDRPALFRDDDIKRATTRIYNAARDGKITRYGTDTWGGARWALPEVHCLLRIPPK